MSVPYAILLVLSASPTATPEPPTGRWRAWLDSPGGELPFALEFTGARESLRATIVNGAERIDVPMVLYEKSTVVLDLPHYDSRIEARRTGDRFDGMWRKRRSADEWTEMGFHATAGASPRFAGAVPPAVSVDGRWAVDFDSSDDTAVGIFESTAHGLAGTFVTTTGDYRFLAGDVSGRRLRLSCFDGAHAFLFTAELDADDVLHGDFFSRDAWHETWTATRDDYVALADPYEQTTWQEGWALDDALFPDTDGRLRSLADPEFAGRARIVQVFGTWCPNCNDETAYLVELDRRYRERGLSIVGLAFELTGDLERDTLQVQRFREHHGVRYPILVAGLANKEKATRAFPALDFVRSYPTTIFLDAGGRVRAVHSGFTGPATGDAYDTVRREFEDRIEQLLAEDPPGDDATRSFVRGRTFDVVGDAAGVRSLTFGAGGERVTTRDARGVEREQACRISGNSVFFGSDVLRVDRRAGVLLDLRRFGRRAVPAGLRSPTPSIAAGLRGDEVGLVRLASDLEAPPVRRREAIVALTELRRALPSARNDDIARWLADESLAVALAATWAAGELRVSSARPRVVEQLDDPNAALRRESVRALARLGVGKARATLVALRDDPDPLVRAAVAAVLGEN